MKILDVFKTKAGESELDKALNGIVALEKKRAEAALALEDARRALEAKTLDAVGGETTQTTVDKAAAGVAAALSKVAAADNLIYRAMNEAKLIISSGAPARKEKITELEAKIRETQKAIGRRLAVEIAEFTSRHGLTVQWPREHMAGNITVPIFAGLPADEVQAIVAAATTDKHIDQQAGELDSLMAELLKQNTMAGLPAADAVNVLLPAVRRRTA
jgi:hypothetical protein